MRGDNYSPLQGDMIKNDGTIVNIIDLLEEHYNNSDSSTNNLTSDLSNLKSDLSSFKTEFENMLTKTLDDITQSFKIIETDHHYIHLGKYFAYSEYITLATTAKHIMAFKTPASGIDVHIRGTVISTFGDNMRMLLREGITYTGGSDVKAECYNHNRKLTNTTTMQSFLKGVTLATNGTILLPTFIGGGTGVGQARTGGGSPSQNEWVLKQNTIYAIEFINNSSANNVLNFTINWYEEDEI